MRWSRRRLSAAPWAEPSGRDREGSGRIESIVLEVTGDCNNACPHCYNYWRGQEPGQASRGLSGEDWLGILEKISAEAPLKQVALSGGEPLLCRDLPEIASGIVGMGLSVVVITNGTLLNRSMLKRIPAGCTFEVTLFSADARIHDALAGRRVFKNLIRNLSRIEIHGHGFVLAVVVTRLNAYDVGRTMKLGIALGAQAVMLNRVNLSRRAFSKGQDMIPSASQLRSSLADADEQSVKYKIPTLVSVPVPPCVADPREYPDLHFGWCPRGGHDAYYTVGGNGDLRPCNHSSVVLGNLCRQGFAEIVMGKQTRDFWNSVPVECQGCTHPLKSKCRGGCPAAADECYGTANRRDPFVELSLGHA